MTPDEMNFAGIYAIRHVTDGKVYVGQAQNIARRIRQHVSSRSGCTHIKNAIQAYGWAEFEVSVLETIEDFEMFDNREEYWIGALNAADPRTGYNICPTAGSTRGVAHSPEARAKMSAAKNGKPLSAEHKARIAEGSKNNGAADKRHATLQAAYEQRVSITRKRQQKTVDMKAYFRLSEVAKMLGVSYVTMWRWCNDGKVATVELPSGQRRILGAEVNRLMSQPEPQEA